MEQGQKIADFGELTKTSNFLRQTFVKTQILFILELWNW